MNKLPDSNLELQQLLAALVEGDISDEQFQTLGKMLLGNPTVQQQYREYMELHAMLQFEHRPTPAILLDAAGAELPLLDALPPAPIPSTASDPPRPWFGGGWQSAGFLVLTIVLGIAVAEGWLLYRDHAELRGPGRVQIANKVEPQAIPAAFLTVDNGVIWGGDRPLIRNVGSAVQLGDELALNEGIAEFRLSSGVYLSIEGPASIVLASPSALVLQYGKLTAHVPWTVTDFKAIAGACRFTACDAEFGLLQDGNKVEVHVFSGAVQAESPQVVRETGGLDFVEGGSLVIDDAGAFTKGTITAGNALSLVSEGDVLKVGDVGQKAKPENFATKLPMAGALSITKEYIDAVLASQPIGYWRFESAKGGIVANEIAGGSDLKVVGNVRLTGRVENSAVEFQPKSSAHLISDPLNVLADSDYTLEVWVKPSHVHKGNVLSLMWTTADRSGSTSLELQGTSRSRATKNPPGAVRFVHHTPRGRGEIGTSCFSKKPYDVRRWQHIVAVKEGSRMRLYVDGKPSGTARDNTSFSTDLRLLVGWVPFNPMLGFVGQMDEVAIYKRALSEKEIIRHHEAVEDAINAPPRSPNDARQALYPSIQQETTVSNALASLVGASNFSGHFSQ